MRIKFMEEKFEKKFQFSIRIFFSFLKKFRLIYEKELKLTKCEHMNIAKKKKKTSFLSFFFDYFLK